MTVRVVRKLDREVACANCECVLAYDMEDTKVGSRGVNYGGESREPNRYITCPECEWPVWVKEKP